MRLIPALLSLPEEGTAQEEGDQKRLTAGPQRLKKIRRFDLSSVVRPLSPDKQQQLSLEAFKRILAAESKLVIVEIPYTTACAWLCAREMLACFVFLLCRSCSSQRSQSGNSSHNQSHRLFVMFWSIPHFLSSTTPG